ncbi:MAG: universal stress protein [Candidatus Heimdallarchaeaceae archaeon]
MSHPEKKDAQTEVIEEQKQKFANLLPSIEPAAKPIKNVLVLIDGSKKSRTVVLLAEELRLFFQAKVDVICFYAKQETDIDDVSKESYENSLSFAYEHLSSKDYAIKGHVVEDIDGLRATIDAIVHATDYDLIAVPSSFIGMKKTITKKEEEEEEARTEIMGDVFNYLLEENNIPVLIVESQELNTEEIWKHTGIVTSSIPRLGDLIEKAIQYSIKGAYIHAILTINRYFYQDLSDEQFDNLVAKQKEEIQKFERANLEVFKDSNRFIDFEVLALYSHEELKKQMISFGKDLGLLIIYLPTKLSNLYGLFIDLLSDPDITVPLLIITEEIKKKEIKVKTKAELKNEKEKEKEEEEEKKTLEKEVVVSEKEKVKEEKLKIDDEIKEVIKEEVKKELFGEEERIKEEKIQKIEKKEREDKEHIEKKPLEKEEKEIGEIEEMDELDELKNEVKEEVKEKIKRELKKEIKEIPKKELKKEILKELSKEELEILKEEIIDEVKEELKEEIKYELKKEMKEPRKEINEKVIAEITKETEDEAINKTKKELDETEDEEEEFQPGKEFE